MDYDEGDELPVVDDLEVAAAAAAAAMEGQHSEESSSEESSSSGSESSDTEEGMSEDDDEDMGRQGGVHGRELERVAVDLLVDDAGQ